MAEARITKDQNKLNEAVKANKSLENDPNSSFNAQGNVGETIQDAGIYGGIGAWGAGAVSKNAKNLVNAPIASNTGVSNAIGRTASFANSSPASFFKGAGKLAGTARTAASIFSPLGVYTMADMAVSGYRDDGKGISQLGGEALGEGIGNLFNDTSRGAMTDRELQAIKDGYNPNKPIYEDSETYSPFGGSSKSRKLVGYEKLAPRPDTPDTSYNSGSSFNTERGLDGNLSFEQLSRLGMGGQSNAVDQLDVANATQATPEVPVAAPVVEAPVEATQSSEFDSTYQGKDGKIYGIKRGQKVSDAFENPIELTPEQIQSFRDSQLETQKDKPAFAYVNSRPEEGLYEFNDEKGRVAYGAEQDAFEPSVPSSPSEPVSDQTAGELAQANFERFRDSGEKMSPEKIKQAEDFAASAGRTFDEKTGYSEKFNPEILDEYNARKGVAEKSAFEIASQERQDRIGKKSDFNTPTMRDSSGNQVPATEENRAKRNRYNADVRAAEEEGLSRSEAKAVADEKARDRLREEEDRANLLADRDSRNKYNELNLKIAEENLAAKIAERNKVELPEGVSPSQFSGVRDILEDNGIDFDPETGALTTKVDKFMWPDGTINIEPNSALMQMLKSVEGAELFLAPPPSVQSRIDEVQEGGGIQSDDGRYYKKINGELVHSVTPPSLKK